MYYNYYCVEFNLKTFQITKTFLPQTEGEFTCDDGAMFLNNNLVAESYISFDACFEQISSKLKQHVDDLKNKVEFYETAYTDLEFQRKYGEG